MNQRSGQTATPAIIVISIFAIMFVATVTFFVYQFQRGSSKNRNKSTQTNSARTNTNTAGSSNQNTNSSGVDLTPLQVVPDTWKYYADAEAGYAFRYPANWSLQEVLIPNDPIQKIPVRFVKVTNPTGQVVVQIGLRRVAEAYGISNRTSAPTGKLNPGIEFTIGQTAIKTTYLEADEHVLAIFYYPLQPFGFVYLEGREFQAETNLVTVPGLSNPIQSLIESTETAVANSIVASLTMNDVSDPIVPPPAAAAPLGQYRVETYRASPRTTADTRLVNVDGGHRTVIIDSTRLRAGLPEGTGLMRLAFPAFGDLLYLHEMELRTGAVGGAIWTYNVKTKVLTKQAGFPAVGWGTLVMNASRTKAVYVSSIDINDSGDIRTLYYLDLVGNSLAKLVELRDNQTFSSGWGGANNAFAISFKSEAIVKYTFYNQSSGNKQTRQRKVVLGDGQATVPGANPVTQVPNQ